MSEKTQEKSLNENGDAVQEITETNRKRVIQQDIAGQIPAHRMPDIRAGVCEFCGIPPNKCGNCGHPINPEFDKEGIAVYPTNCQSMKCGIELRKEWYEPLAFCKHYSKFSPQQLVCKYCKEKTSLTSRKIKVRAIEKADGSEALVLICPQVECLEKFKNQYLK